MAKTILIKIKCLVMCQSSRYIPTNGSKVGMYRSVPMVGMVHNSKVSFDNKNKKVSFYFVLFSLIRIFVA